MTEIVEAFPLLAIKYLFGNLSDNITNWPEIESGKLDRFPRSPDASHEELPSCLDCDTGFLMPPSVDEWLSEEHLVRFVVDVVASLDLRVMLGRDRGYGEASYHPTVNLGILVYGYTTDVFSSRKLERASYDSVAFRFVAANQHPDHDPIAAFRRRFLDEIQRSRPCPIVYRTRTTLLWLVVG